MVLPETIWLYFTFENKYPASIASRAPVTVTQNWQLASFAQSYQCFSPCSFASPSSDGFAFSVFKQQYCMANANKSQAFLNFSRKQEMSRSLTIKAFLPNTGPEKCFYLSMLPLL